MSKPFDELRKKMSPESQKRAAAKTAEMLETISDAAPSPATPEAEGATDIKILKRCWQQFQWMMLIANPKDSNYELSGKWIEECQKLYSEIGTLIASPPAAKEQKPVDIKPVDVH